jgi:RNA methyltransferase, TrmH family
MLETISSPANPKIKAIRKLRERKERQQTGLCYIEGLRIVTEAVQQGAEIAQLVISPQLLTSEFGREVVDQASKQGIFILEVSPQVFQALSLKEGPAGLAAVVKQRWTRLEDARPEVGRTWVALDSVADPGNLGTILRTQDAVGGSGVILLDDSTDPFDPTAIRASMGAVFTQRLVKATIPEFAGWKQSTGAQVIGTSDKAKTDYHYFSYPPAPVILMGSERQGLHPEAQKVCDQVVSIPMLGRSDSLNLAVATGIVLYEVLNQRRKP